MQKERIAQLYQPHWHLRLSLTLILLPVVFLWLFSKFIHVPISNLLGDISVSLYRMGIAYFLAAVFGWTLAILSSRGKKAAFFLPLFDVLQSFPTFAALPLATYFFGPSDSTVIFFLIFAIIWPILFSIVSSLRLIRHDWQEAVEIFGLSGFLYLKKFLLPVTFPGLITGSIIGLGDAWEAIIVTEILVKVKSGLGIFFQKFSDNPTITAFGILGFLTLIFTINKLIWLPLLELSHQKLEE